MKPLMFTIIVLLLNNAAFGHILLAHEYNTKNEVLRITEIQIDLPSARDIMTADYTELQCLAVNIYHEARGESQLGQELVAQVTMNRVRDSRWSNTVCGVVREPRQFAWTHDGKPDMVTDAGAYLRAYLIAVQYLYEGKVANFPHAKEIVNFHSSRNTPTSWVRWVEYVGEVGGHRFYRSSEAIRMASR